MIARSYIVAARAILVTLAASAAQAQVPLNPAFTYQGRLQHDNQPLNGNVNLVLRLHDAPVAGALLGTQTLIDVPVVDGLFTVELNSAAEFGADAFNGEARWLEIEVNGTPLAPRQPITAAPYALYSLGPWQTTGANIAYTAGNVGVGVAIAEYTLDLSGDLRARGRYAFGNEAEFGTGSGAFAEYARIFDFSERIQDFAGAKYWTPVLSTTTADPASDLTGEDQKIILHSLTGAQTPPESERNLYHLEGGEIFARHSGSGHVDALVGAVADCWLNGPGTVTSATGLYAGSFVTPSATGTIESARGIEVVQGNGGAGATITTSTGVHVATPNTAGPILNNYGIYIEDQAVGQDTSYAFYAAGGTSYFGGDIGIGTPTPASKVDIAASGDGAELLRFSTDRPWVFRQVSEGPTAGLQLLSTVGVKKFEVAAALGTSVATFFADDSNPRVGIGTTDPQSRLDVAGDIRVSGPDPRVRLYANINGTGNGAVFTNTSGGTSLVGLTYIVQAPQNGAVAVGHPGNFAQGLFGVDQSNQSFIVANVKNFREINPADVSTDIWYACLEGPEVAVYCRGTASLVDGRAIIALPEHFRAMAVEEGLTVQLTPHSVDSLGLAVVRKSLDGIEVGELARGRGNYEFDWRVEAVRKGHEEYRVVRSWDEMMPAGGDREQMWQARQEELQRILERP